MRWRRIEERALVGLAALLVIAPSAPRAEATGRAAALSDATLQRQLAAAMASSGVPRKTRGALAVELDSGKLVYAEGAAHALAPASTEKLYVAFAALRVLGAATRIETDVLSDGFDGGDGHWAGDLVLKGRGDPSLSSARLSALAQRIRAQGITRVSGAIVGDESFFDSRRTVAGWKPSFAIEESPPLSALTVDGAVFDHKISRNPALAAAVLFKRALERAGVRVAGRSRVGVASEEALVLASTSSKPLWMLLRRMERESDNHMAELFLKQLGTVDGAVGTSGGGAAVVRRTLSEAGVPLAGVHIVDGSGLSLLDRSTPAAFVGLLQAVWDDPPLRRRFIGLLAVAGQFGTLADRMRGPPTSGNVLAKTGTTDVACTLAGYVRDRYAFAILHNGHPVPVTSSRRAQDRFVTLLARQ